MTLATTYVIPYPALCYCAAKPEVISGALGHSSAAFTTDVYSYPEGKVCVPPEKMC